MQNIAEYLASINIYHIPVKTPYPIGPVNSYLIKKPPYTLIDPGPDTAAARQSLAAGLEKAGAEPGEIRRIVLTHFHNDHSGLAKWMHDSFGTEIFVHKNEVRKLQPDYDYFTERLPFLEEAGLTRKELNDICRDKDPVPTITLPEQGVIPLTGGEAWTYDDRKVSIIHVPGHSSGHIALYDEDHRLFFAGDFVLKDVTPNPFMEAGNSGSHERLPVLSQYMNSIKLFAGMPIRLVLPGHGPFIEGNSEIAAALLAHHGKRLDQYEALVKGREMSAKQLMQIIYPEVKGFEIFMAVSEIMAHLDYLVSGGRLDRHERDGVGFYRQNNWSGRAGCV